MENVGVRELQCRPMEFMQFGTHEPYFTLQKLISELLGLTPSEVSEGLELVEQVSFPKEIISIARKRVGRVAMTPRDKHSNNFVLTVRQDGEGHQAGSHEVQRGTHEDREDRAVLPWHEDHPPGPRGPSSASSS